MTKNMFICIKFGLNNPSVVDFTCFQKVSLKNSSTNTTSNIQGEHKNTP
jgi:hypothetical protein